MHGNDRRDSRDKGEEAVKVEVVECDGVRAGPLSS